MKKFGMMYFWRTSSILYDFLENYTFNQNYEYEFFCWKFEDKHFA